MAEIPEELAPTGDDERSGDTEYNPAVEPDKAAAWLNLLKESEKAFEEWNDCLRQHREAVRQPVEPALDHARQAVQFVLGQPRDPEAKHLRQEAGGRGGAEVQGPPAAVSGDQRAARALRQRGVRSHAHQRPADAGARRSRHHRPRRGVVPLRAGRRGAREAGVRLRRPQAPQGFSALAVAQLARGDVGRRRQLSDQGAGQGAVQRVQRRRVPARRIQGRQGSAGDRRQRQPRARQVLGDLAQGHEQGGVGRRGLRGRARRGRAAASWRTSTISSRARCRPIQRPSRAR